MLARGMKEEALADPGVEMQWMDSSCTAWSPGQRWWRRGEIIWGGAQRLGRWGALAPNSWWGWGRAEWCAGISPEMELAVGGHRNALWWKSVSRTHAMMPRCFQNISNPYWSDHLTRDRESANVSKGKVSSFKWNWLLLLVLLVLHACHTSNLILTF